jgi:hypothetical protein
MYVSEEKCIDLERGLFLYCENIINPTKESDLAIFYISRGLKMLMYFDLETSFLGMFM